MENSKGQHRATVAEVNIPALKNNFQTLQSLLKPGVETMAVVKADAYGHGALPCAQALVEAGARSLGVGVVEEGVQIREKGISVPIQVLCGIFPEEIDDLIRFKLTTTLSTLEMAKTLAIRAEKLNTQVGVHIKVNTGMGRLGIPPEEATDFIEQVRSLKTLRIDSLFTHFSTADEHDPEYSQKQLKLFEELMTRLAFRKILIPKIHAANSSALLKFPESQFDLVRPGILLYGALTSPGLEPYRKVLEQQSTSFQPVMQWKTRIININEVPSDSSLSYGRKFTTKKQSKIATLPVGYADGLQRNLSGKIEVLVNGKRAPQVGTICMDLCLVDVSDIPEPREGDEVVLFGNQGNETIRIEEVALHGNTIPYEIMCCVGKRVPRVYTVE
ncbi:MAG: alanine racemase [Candidatus Nitronauta litoralis]|uniref:Alanine racemase n=1 Tax=Candidatus Nitronauta litoralis TaxID=2705533 RepID=A0A7T0BZK9_9BACT|nr:MAG: alanine racemase [Candidatus Nitronauta litoralis]